MGDYLSIEAIRERESQAIKAWGAFTLMERAGQAAARYIFDHYPPELYPKVIIFCGKGNNGGDGFVVARLLKNMFDYQVSVFVLGHISQIKAPALEHFENIYRDLPINFFEEDSPAVKIILEKNLKQNDLIVDALYGVGFHDSITGLSETMITLINQAGRPVISLDIPSGVHGDKGPGTCFIHPSATISFLAAKSCMQSQPELFGEIVIDDLGVMV